MFSFPNSTSIKMIIFANHFAQELLIRLLLFYSIIKPQRAQHCPRHWGGGRGEKQTVKRIITNKPIVLSAIE